MLAIMYRANGLYLVLPLRLGLGMCALFGFCCVFSCRSLRSWHLLLPLNNMNNDPCIHTVGNDYCQNHEGLQLLAQE